MESKKDNQEDDDYLPDLPEEISGEQVVLQQCVFRANEVFVKTHNNILKWLNSPPEFRVYPTDAHNNKHAYKKKASMYSYDRKRGIMYKKIKNTDGIHKHFFHLVLQIDHDCVNKTLILFTLIFHSVQNLFQCNISERTVEVVFSVKQQDATISSCYSGILTTLESRAMGGHFGR